MIEPPRAHRPLYASGVVRLAALVLLAMTVVGSWPQRADGQTDDGEAAARPGGRITAVDAATEVVAIELVGLTEGSDAAALEVEGRSVSDAEVTTTLAQGRAAEVVIIVDAHVRGTASGALDASLDAVTAAVAAAPEGTSIGILAAGDGAQVVLRPTVDRSQVATALETVTVRNRSSLHGAVERAATLFSDDGTTVKSVVVVATGPDDAGTADLNHALVPLLQGGVQVFSVGFGGGDPALDSLAGRTAGLAYGARTVEELTVQVTRALDDAPTRTVVSFPDTDGTESRIGAVLTIGDQTFDFSYPAGLRTVNPLQLTPKAVAGDDGFVLFGSTVGLYVALSLAFVGITLGIWAVGTMMAGGSEGLDGMLARYTEGQSDDLLEGEAEELVVQSALLQRAVTLGETFAERQGFKARVEDMLEQANIPVRVGEAMFVLAAAVVLASGFGLVLTRSLLGALLLGVLSIGVVFFVVRFRGRRRFKQFESQLPDTLQLLAGTLRAGYSLPQGLDAVSNEIADPMGQELRRAMTESRLGRDLEESLNGVAERMTSPDFAWTVMAISIQREVGGNLNELLLSVSDTMLARDRLKREVSALTAEGKMSAGVLSFLPPGLGAIMWVINPEYISVLFTETMGNVLLGLGLLSGTVGLAWMKKVITVDV